MKRGFTLAEVLITLGIVGVVAVLTLPNMMKNHQKRVLVAQLQRTYNAIENAMPSFMDDARAITLYDTDAFNGPRSGNETIALEIFVRENFKIAKLCNSNTKGGTSACYGQEYRDLNGVRMNDFGGEVCAILKTGATLCFNRMWYRNDFSLLYVDVNGPQGPNVWGRDAFDLEMNRSGEVGESFDQNPENVHHRAESCGQLEGAYSSGCFNKIIEDGWTMDY